MIKPLLGLLLMYVVHDVVTEEVGARAGQSAPLAAAQARCLAQCSELLGTHRVDGFIIHPRLNKMLNLTRGDDAGATIDGEQQSGDEAACEDCSGDDLTGPVADSASARADLFQYPERHSSGQTLPW